jgi:hypothetical protein
MKNIEKTCGEKLPMELPMPAPTSTRHWLKEGVLKQP